MFVEQLTRVRLLRKIAQAKSHLCGNEALQVRTALYPCRTRRAAEGHKWSSVTTSLPLLLLHITKPSSSSQSRLSALSLTAKPDSPLTRISMSIAPVRKKLLPVTAGAAGLKDALTVCLDS